jgi:hypothetical protein
VNPTFSKLDIFADCRLAACLPRASSTSKYATEGTAFHEFLDRVVALQAPAAAPGGAGEVPGMSPEGAREAALAEAPLELRAALARLRLDTLSLDPSMIATEVAFAYDVRTGGARELGRRLGRKYAEAAAAVGQPLTEHEYCGAIDRAALVGERGAYLGDYKRFGWNLKPAKESWQLRAGALSLARAWKREWVDVEHLVIGEDGEVYGGVSRLDAFDLDSFEAELSTLHMRMEEDREAYLDGDVPEATLSDRCKYCPGANYCPARFTFAAQILRGEHEEVAAIVKAERPALLITEENAPRLWTMKNVAEKVLEDLDKALREYAYVTPFTLADGKVVGPVPANSRKITDGARARSALEDLVGPEIAKLGWSTEVAIGSLRDVARAAAEKLPGLTTIDDREEWLFGELVARGVAVKTEGRKVQAKPAPKAKKTTKAA